MRVPHVRPSEGKRTIGADPAKLDVVQAYLAWHFAAPVDQPGPRDHLIYRFRVLDLEHDPHELRVWRNVLDDSVVEGVEAVLAARDIARRLRVAGRRAVVLSGFGPEDVYEEPEGRG